MLKPDTLSVRLPLNGGKHCVLGMGISVACGLVLSGTVAVAVATQVPSVTVTVYVPFVILFRFWVVSPLLQIYVGLVKPDTLSDTEPLYGIPQLVLGVGVAEALSVILLNISTVAVAVHAPSVTVTV